MFFLKFSRFFMRLVLLLVLLIVLSCGNGNDTVVYEGYMFSKNNIIYITIDSDKNIYYTVIEGDKKGKSGSAKLKKVGKNRKIYEYKNQDTLFRIVLFSYSYKSSEDDHMVVSFIKDNNFPSGEFTIGMIEKQKGKPIPIRVLWADGTYSSVSIDETGERSTYRSFEIMNFAKDWRSQSAETVSKLLENPINGKLTHIKDNPYTYEYRFIGSTEGEQEKSIDLLADGETIVVRYSGLLEKGVEIGIKNKSITIDDFEEGRRLWILCSDGSWAQGEIDDFHPTPDEADTIEKPKIDFVFNNGEKTKLYVSFNNELCSINVSGSFACDFLTPYILDPKAQLIVLNNYKTDAEDNPVDCVGGW